jgi:hypothetical protein
MPTALKETELHLPDEDRILVVLAGEYNRCICGRMPVLERKAGKYQVRCKNVTDKSQRWILDELGITCLPDTGWQSTSAKAKQIWFAVKALTK